MVAGEVQRVVADAALEVHHLDRLPSRTALPFVVAHTYVCDEHGRWRERGRGLSKHRHAERAGDYDRMGRPKMHIRTISLALCVAHVTAKTQHGQAGRSPTLAVPSSPVATTSL